VQYAGAFMAYYHTKFHMSVSSNSLVIATQPNAKGISHENQVNLTLHKVSSISVPHCVMLFRTLHCVKYYTTVLTNRLDGTYSGKMNSILYQVHTLHAIFAMLNATSMIPCGLFCRALCS